MRLVESIKSKNSLIKTSKYIREKRYIIMTEKLTRIHYTDIRPFTTKDDHHRYFHDGVQVPSVTTVLKLLSTDALVYWANSLGWNRRSVKDELSRASNVGSTAHLYVYYIFNNDAVSAKNIIRDLDNMTNIKERDEIMNSILSFNEWWADNRHRVEVIEMEEPLTMPGCGGTPDLICKLDGIYTVIDFKTSKDIYFNYLLQLAKCAELYEYNHPEVKFEELAILKIDKLGGTQARLFKLQDVFNRLDSEDPLNKLTEEEAIFLLKKTFNAVLNAYKHVWMFQPLR